MGVEILLVVTMRIQFSGVWHRVDWYIITNILKRLADSMFRIEECFILRTEAAYFSEILVMRCQTT
jgi:hypothetical protein